MKTSHPANLATDDPDDLSRRALLKLAGMGAAFCALPLGALAGSTPSFTGNPNSHDLSLSNWGPYSKKYFGISHIADAQRGLSFDLSIFPWIDPSKSRLPSVQDAKSLVHPWEASSDLRFYTFREEIAGKDQFYCNVSFFARDDRNRIARLELVNHTSVPRQVQVQSLAQFNYPPVAQYTAEPIRLVAVSLPPSGMWVEALDYVNLQFHQSRPTDNAVQDGLWRAEQRRSDAFEFASALPLA